MNKSKMWEANIDSIFSKIDDDFFKNFRELGNANGKMTAWNANEPTTRWFKFLLFNRVKEKNDDFLSKYKMIGDTSLGNPIFVTYKKVDINLDYLLGIEEFDFIDKNLNFKDIKTIVEIGAGFGRTAHVLLKIIDSINKYVIIDLPELLIISKRYLRSVLSEDLFSKIYFFSNLDENIKNIKSDLVININSFQEMTTDVIDYYMSNVIKYSNYFFSRNAICKYTPSMVNIDDSNLLDVLELGYCKETIDIFDDIALDKQINKYIQSYKPFNNWSVVSGESDLFPYYYNILYKKN
jgi:putative sugar O-methyltransferase